MALAEGLPVRFRPERERGAATPGSTWRGNLPTLIRFYGNVLEIEFY